MAAGDSVEAGQVLCVAELVKTTHEVTAPTAGRIVSLGSCRRRHWPRAQCLAVLEARAVSAPAITTQGAAPGCRAADPAHRHAWRHRARHEPGLADPAGRAFG